MLATAIVLVIGHDNDQHLARVFLDMGSQVSCINESLVQQLKLKRWSGHGACSGIGDTPVEVNGISQFVMVSRDQNHTFTITALILRKVTRTLPLYALDIEKWPHIKQLELADPEFYKPASVGILLGADVFGKLMAEGFMDGDSNTPYAQNTKLGWILYGPLTRSCSLELKATTGLVHALQHEEMVLDVAIRKLWQLQEPLGKQIMTREEMECEEFFVSSHTRDQMGRYIVRIPLKDNPSVLGDSRKHALQRFYQMENRIHRHSDIAKQYTDFMETYLAMGHMRIADRPVLDPSRVYYIQGGV